MAIGFREDNTPLGGVAARQSGLCLAGGAPVPHGGRVGWATCFGVPAVRRPRLATCVHHGARPAAASVSAWQGATRDFVVTVTTPTLCPMRP
eukprot:363429-Chlamydomonas_euryale.AAC.12